MIMHGGRLPIVIDRLFLKRSSIWFILGVFNILNFEIYFTLSFNISPLSVVVVVVGSLFHTNHYSKLFTIFL